MIAATTSYCGFALQSAAHGATRTACLDLTFKEARDLFDDNSPASGDPGAIRGRLAYGTPTNAVGHLFELWDKDSGGVSNDEFIGTFVKVTDGRGCATFEWENSSAFHGEANPDVYVNYTNTVRATLAGDDTVRAVQENLNPYLDITWRDGTAADPDEYVAVNCAAPSCDITAVGWALAITTDTVTSRAERINALDTAQRALEQFFGFFDESDDGIDMIYPCTDPANCPGFASFQDREYFKINGTTSAFNGRSSAHELGHILMANQFEQDDLPNDATLGGPSYIRTLPEFESKAVIEAWADFVAMRSWWNGDDIGSVPLVDGLDMEDGTPWESNCAANSGLVHQVAKGFWDLVDVNNEIAVAPAGSDDSFDTTAGDLAVGWDRFLPGNLNRQYNEPNGGIFSNDPDGRNLRDYFAVNDGEQGFNPGGGSFWASLLSHNCTGTQDAN